MISTQMLTTKTYRKGDAAPPLVPGQMRILKNCSVVTPRNIFVWVWAVMGEDFLLSHNGSGVVDEFRALDRWHAQGHIDWEEDMLTAAECILEVHGP